jgi:hypothetical protein
MSKRDLDVRSFKTIKLGMSKEQIKEEVYIEATYDKEQAKKKIEKERLLKNK